LSERPEASRASSRARRKQFTRAGSGFTPMRAPWREPPFSHPMPPLTLEFTIRVGSGWGTANQNPKSKIQNPKSKIPSPPPKKMQNQKKNAECRMQNPKSRIQTVDSRGTISSDPPGIRDEPSSNPLLHSCGGLQNFARPRRRILTRAEFCSGLRRIRVGGTRMQIPKSKACFAPAGRGFPQNPESKIRGLC